MQSALRETCQQYVTRRLSEGWRIVCSYGHSVYLSPPDGKFLRPVDLRNDVLTIRPNANGDVIELTAEPGVATDNWENVYEADPPDEDTSYNYIPSGVGTWYDLYELVDHTTEAGTINHVKVYIRCRATTIDGRTCQVKIKTGGVEYEGAEEVLTTSYAPYSKQWDTNPGGGSWTWAQIDALQAGVSLYVPGRYKAMCTQVYVEVDYTLAGWSGKVSGVTDPAKVMGVDVANIAKVKGVESA